MDWIEEEERKEREAAEVAEAAEIEAKRIEEDKWMLEQLKKQHGDDFGEDLNTDFSG